MSISNVSACINELISVLELKHGVVQTYILQTFTKMAVCEYNMYVSMIFL